MSTFDFTSCPTWGGRPVARRVADVLPRRRAVITGTVTSAHVVETGGSPSFCCEINDGSGLLEVVFLGRRSVPGLEPGVRCTVEGTAGMGSVHMVLWNPLYRLEHDREP